MFSGKTCRSPQHELALDDAAGKRRRRVIGPFMEFTTLRAGAFPERAGSRSKVEKKLDMFFRRTLSGPGHKVFAVGKLSRNWIKHFYRNPPAIQTRKIQHD